MYFDEFMEMCLYDKDSGYFSSGEIRPGTGGDFITSPEVSDGFGTLLGAWASDNRPSDGAAIIEVGAGSGGMLGHLAVGWFDENLPVFAVERSATARKVIALRHPDVEVCSSIDEVPAGLDAVVVANEVLDNMPAALGKKLDDRWVEIAVSTDDDALTLVEVDARARVATWCTETFPDAVEGTTVTAQLAIAAWIRQVYDRFGRVALCLIDYGGTSLELESRELDGIIRTYRRHQTGINWLEHPGGSDLTVDVNIDGVRAAARQIGARVRPLSQRDFLLELGIEKSMDDAAELEHLHASEGRIVEQLQAKSSRINLNALIDPQGLGAFQVFLIN
jgi:SAM-dependent MidA family methyltransferase